jgi:hypothetical protein
MKRLMGILAGATMLASASLQAQSPIDATVAVKVKSFPFQTVATGYLTEQGGPAIGGGFLADFSVNFPAPIGDRTFTDYLVWCIDSGRPITLNVTTNYQLFSLADFAASNNGSTTGHNPDLDDMTRIASLQNELYTGWDAPGTPRANLQGSIWSWFDGYTTYGGNANLATILAGNPNFDTSEYYVLWNGENQTFLTRIPEPSAAVLALFGMGAMLLVARRRRNAM